MCDFTSAHRSCQEVNNRCGHIFETRYPPRCMNGNNGLSDSFMALRASTPESHPSVLQHLVAILARSLTHILISVILTLLCCSPIKPLSTCSFLVLNSLLTTLDSFLLACPSLNVLVKKEWTSCTVTMGGNSAITSCASIRIPWEAIKERAAGSCTGWSEEGRR